MEVLHLLIFLLIGSGHDCYDYGELVPTIGLDCRTISRKSHKGVIVSKQVIQLHLPFANLSHYSVCPLKLQLIELE
jgi:hypothetical protein